MKTCDKVNEEFILPLLKNTKDDEQSRNKLSEELNKILDFMRTLNEQNEPSTEFKITAEILDLIRTERRLAVTYKDKYLAYKFHLFLWIKETYSYERIFHIDDYDRVYYQLGVTDKNDMRLRPVNIPYNNYGIQLKKNSNLDKDVTVHCIPFSVENSDIVFSTAIAGMNLYLGYIIEQLESLTVCSNFCGCFFSNETLEVYRTANYVRLILKELLITPHVLDSTPNEIKSENEITRPLLRGGLKLHFSPELVSILKSIPFERLNSLPAGKNLKLVQEQLNTPTNLNIPTASILTPMFGVAIPQ